MTLREPVVWVHRTGKAGVIPAFNVEGGLEKEARINKEKMEKVCLVFFISSDPSPTHDLIAFEFQSPSQTSAESGCPYPSY